MRTTLAVSPPPRVSPTTSETPRSATPARGLSRASFAHPPVPQSSRSYPKERADFQDFEGNAQGFRVLTRLQLEQGGGLQLTAATLAAFSKYPRESGRELKVVGHAATKKQGIFQDDKRAFEAIVLATGLRRVNDSSPGLSWARHPLALIVEAADDICYSILDIEDGFRLGLVPMSDAEQLLRALASTSTQFSSGRLAALGDAQAVIGYLRAMAIGRLIDECASIFLDNESAILEGKHRLSLTEQIPGRDSFDALNSLAKQCCYQSPGVLEIELAGDQALRGLLSQFVDAISAEGDEQTFHAKQAGALLRRRGVRIDNDSLYQRVLRVTDYVSGMTDRHALSTFRRLAGIAIPGRVS